MDKPLISVIVPVYNTAPYLGRCVDSILAQTYPNLEVILVDDGSTDGSGAICDEYAQKDVRVRAIHQANAGVSAARNAALDEIRGEWFALVDSDDYIEPEMYEKLLEAAISNNVPVAACGFAEHHTDGSIEDKVSTDMPPVIDVKKHINRGSLKPVKVFLSLSKLYHRSIVGGENKIRYDTEIHRGEDTLFRVQVFLRVDKMAYLPQPWYRICHRKVSLSKSRIDEKQMTQFVALRKLAKMLQHEAPALARWAKHKHTKIAFDRINEILQSDVSGEQIYIPALRKNAWRFIRAYYLVEKPKLNRIFRDIALLLCPVVIYKRLIART